MNSKPPDTPQPAADYVIRVEKACAQLTAESITLDTGHVVAFDASVQYKVRKAGSWKSTILGGEGLVTDFTGPGRVWLQTRSSADLISWITQRLPASRK